MDELKIVIGFVAGVGVGVLAARSYFKKQYKAIADEEIMSVKRAYHMSQPEEPKDIQDYEDSAVYADRSSISYDDLVNAIEQQKKDIRDEILETEHPVEEDVPVYEISVDTFAETEIAYDKNILHYFVDDGILFDPTEVKVVEPSVLGEENMDVIRTSYDIYSLYFRNDKLGCDYEVIKVSGSYYEDV